ncbi:MAG TPA: pitrilysin family protein [Polyangiales bacterium]|jgi:zinc protease|nr:pitrilysin family protein [Polyangiales bacterium]
MGATEVLIERLNAGVRKRNARLEFVREQAFGDALRLRRYRLGNGLTVLTLVDRSAPTVSYHTWFRVGSRHERPGKTGLAHLFEHLMFNETLNHPPGEFDRLMERAGAEANAATWTDWTYYYENAPRGSLPLLIELEADRMGNLVLRGPQVSSEKEVVVNERKMRVDDDAEGKALELLYRSAFRRHPYRWPTIGWMADIRAFTVQDCREFYRKHYAPSNATIVIAGDFNERTALSLVQKHYGGFSRAPVARQQTSSKEPLQHTERVFQLEAPTPTEKILIGYRAPAFSDPHTPALVIANEVLFGGQSSRLHRLFCIDKELALAVRGSISPFVDPGLFEIWVFLREGKSKRNAIELLDRELERLGADGPTETEVEKAINQLELSFLHNMETAAGKAEQIGFHETVLNDGAAVFDRLAAYREVTADEVKQAVRKYLRPSRRTRVEIVATAS